jgi:hypothetical protein
MTNGMTLVFLDWSLGLVVHRDSSVAFGSLGMTYWARTENALKLPPLPRGGDIQDLPILRDGAAGQLDALFL